MSMQSLPMWSLRFLSGPMRGQTIALRSGRNVVGAAGECTLVLRGDGVLPRHLLLQVGAVAVTVHKLGPAAACVNDVELGEQRRSLVAGDVVSIAGVDFELDRRVVECSRGQDENTDSVLVPWDALPAAPAAPAIAERRRWEPGVLVAMAAIAVTLAGAVWFSSGGSASAASKSSPPAGLDFAEIAAVVAGFPEVQATADARGNVRVTGYVQSEARLSELRNLLAGHGDRLAVKVHAVQEIVERARSYLDEPAVAITYAGRGRLILGGKATAGAREKVRRLAEDMQPSATVSDRIRYSTATSSAPGSSARRRTDEALFPARVVSVTSDANGLRHVQLATGARYYEGAILPSGRKLSAIDMQQMQFFTSDADDAEQE